MAENREVKNDPTVIHLGEDDAAFVIRGDSQIEMMIPHKDDDASVASSARWIAAIGLRFEQDEEWREELKQWFEGLMRS